MPAADRAGDAVDKIDPMPLGEVAKVGDQIVDTLVAKTGTGLAGKGTQCTLGPFRPVVILRVPLMQAGLFVNLELWLIAGE